MSEDGNTGLPALTYFKDHKVHIVLKNGDEFSGKVLEANRTGLIFKYKNSPRSILLEARDILSIDFDKTLTPVTQTKLKWPELHKVRQHLAMHHGFKLSAVNKMRNEEAIDRHDAIHDSEIKQELGHYHPGQDELGNPVRPDRDRAQDQE